MHSARRLPTRQPPASRAIPPRASCSDGCAVGAHRRRSPNQRGGRQPPTQHFTVTGALAARVPYCTRGSRCIARRARAAAAIGSAKCARARTAVPRTAKGGQARSARKRTCRATQCEIAFAPTQPTDLGLVLQAYQQCPAKAEVRPPCHARRSAQRCERWYHNTSVLGQVLFEWTRALVFFRSNLISANALQTLRHC